MAKGSLIVSATSLLVYFENVHHFFVELLNLLFITATHRHRAGPSFEMIESAEPDTWTKTQNSSILSSTSPKSFRTIKGFLVIPLR